MISNDFINMKLRDPNRNMWLQDRNHEWEVEAEHVKPTRNSCLKNIA